MYSEEPEELTLKKEIVASSENNFEIKEKVKKSFLKSKLKLRRCYVVDMSVEEGYALRLYSKS